MKSLLLRSCFALALPLFGLVAPGCAQAQTAPVTNLAPLPNGSKPDIGVGLEGLADWSRAMMFNDVMKTSRKWGKPDQPWVHEVKTDALGWPTEDAGVVAIADTPGIGGTYALSFEGKADVVAKFGAKVENLSYDEATKTSTAQIVVPEALNQIMIDFTGTQGGVRNVKLIRPGADPKATFSKPFLEKLAPFSTLRFMDFQSTNNNPTKSWEERTTPAHASQAREQGGALEYVVELANLADKDVWVNVPDQADDNYVRQMATLLKNGLEKERRVYVEWSNEVWNWQFGQAQRNLQAARIEGKEPNSPLAFDKDQNEGYWAMRRIAKRSAEVGQVFREVFGDKNFERVRPVYATQVGYEEVYKQGLAFLEAQYKQPNSVIYGLAGAPYFNLNEEENKRGDITVEEIFAVLPERIDETLQMAAKLGAYANFYGLKHLAYEGGQHLQDHGNNGSADAKVAANRDPRMGPMVEKYLRGWNTIGGDLFMYFTLSSGYSKWGSWGLVEDITKTSPKYDAALRVLNAPKATLSLGAAPGETVKGGEFFATNRWDKPSANAVRIEPEKWMQYVFRAPKSVEGTLTLQISAAEAAKAQVRLHNQAIALEIAPGSETALAKIPLQSGLNVLRIQGVEGRFELKSLTVN